MSGMSYIRVDEMLTTAAFRGEVDRVREMLDHGGSATAKSETMLTALHWAVSMGHIEVVELLAERGADLNARAADGNSPLHIAAREGDEACVAFLLDAGANPSLRNSSGLSALDLAIDNAEEEVGMIQALRDALSKREAALLRGGGAKAAEVVGTASGAASTSRVWSDGGGAACAPWRVAGEAGGGADAAGGVDVSDPEPATRSVGTDAGTQAEPAAAAAGEGGERQSRMVSTGCGPDASDDAGAAEGAAEGAGGESERRRMLRAYLKGLDAADGEANREAGAAAEAEAAQPPAGGAGATIDSAALASALSKFEAEVARKFDAMGL